MCNAMLNTSSAEQLVYHLTLLIIASILVNLYFLTPYLKNKIVGRIFKTKNPNPAKKLFTCQTKPTTSPPSDNAIKTLQNTIIQLKTKPLKPKNHKAYIIILCNFLPNV